MSTIALDLQALMRNVILMIIALKAYRPLLWLTRPLHSQDVQKR